MDFEFDDDTWTVKALLPAWAGHPDQSSDDSLIWFRIFVHERDDKALTEWDRQRFQWFIDNEAALATRIYSAAYEGYPSVKKQYDDAEEATRKMWADEPDSPEKEWNLSDEYAVKMTDMISIDDLKNHIGVNAVFIHDYGPKEDPYYGVVFNCDWDDEHCFGILMKGEKLLAAGIDEAAFDDLENNSGLL